MPERLVSGEDTTTGLKRDYSAAEFTEELEPGAPENLKKSTLGSKTGFESKAKIMLKVPQPPHQAESPDLYPGGLQNFLKSYQLMEPNPQVFLKGFMPYKASKEELELTKRYLNVNDRVNSRIVREGALKGRRHTTNVAQQLMNNPGLLQPNLNI